MSLVEMGRRIVNTKSEGMCACTAHMWLNVPGVVWTHKHTPRVYVLVLHRRWCNAWLAIKLARGQADDTFGVENTDQSKQQKIVV